MAQSRDPLYLHVGLYAIVVVLVVILIKIAVIDPKEIVQQEKYYQKESRLRMLLLRDAQQAYFSVKGKFTTSVDSLINFLKSPEGEKLYMAIDSITNKPVYKNLYANKGLIDSLRKTPKSLQPYIVLVDTSRSFDSTVTAAGRLLKVDTTITVGTKYRIEDPDGYGTVGDLSNDALKNSASWE
ncbi:MAG: hypothetical protein L6Q59_16465 [Ignavibacteriaceae bacterium]|nr:hypothetical protein [Ignavibacteriaceae bacterium]